MAMMTCPECGKEISSFAKVCPHCGCPNEVIQEMMKEQQPMRKAIEDTVPTDGESSSDESIKYVGIAKTLDQRTFCRDALISIATNDWTPPDVFNSSFTTVLEGTKHIGLFTCRVVGNYSAIIGFDEVRENVVYQNGKSVTKREPYIDWKAFESDYDREHSVVTPLDGDVDDMDAGMIEAYGKECLDLQMLKDEIPTDDIIVPERFVIDDAETRCKNSAEDYCKTHLPGNHYKNFSFSGTSTFKEATCHTIPTYSLPFEYKGEQFQQSFFAVKNHEGAFFGKIPNIGDEIYEAADNKYRKIGVLALVFLVLSALIGIGVFVVKEYLYHAFSIPVIAVPLAVSVALTLWYWIARKVFIVTTIKRNNLNKANTLDRIFEETGLSPLTPEERAAIIGRNKK